MDEKNKLDRNELGKKAAVERTWCTQITPSLNIIFAKNRANVRNCLWCFL
jgi:hypothetical protein